MNRRGWWLRGLKFAAVATVALGAIGWVVMSLWNWLAPALFGGPAIGFWQALGLFVLARVLVGGLRGRGGRHGHWRGRMAARWHAMTDEERAQVRASMGGRCGGQHRTASGPAQGPVPGSVPGPVQGPA